MKKWDYVLVGAPAVLFAAGVLMIVNGQILGEATTSVATTMGLIGILVMLLASRKAAIGQRARQ